MISVVVENLHRSVAGCVVLLSSVTDRRHLQVVIGESEAQAILIRLKGIDVPRPLTHDLLKNVLDVLDCKLVRVEICELKDNIFYSRLILNVGGIERESDSRPSDAIALALRCGAPIQVAESVMESAGYIPEDVVEDKADDEAESTSPPLSPLDALKKKLDEAIRAELYEEAAVVRDEIKELEKTVEGRSSERSTN